MELGEREWGRGRTCPQASSGKRAAQLSSHSHPDLRTARIRVTHMHLRPGHAQTPTDTLKYMGSRCGTPTHTHIPSQTLTLTLTHTLLHTHAHTLSHAHMHAHTHTCTLSHSRTRTRMRALTEEPFFLLLLTAPKRHLSAATFLPLPFFLASLEPLILFLTPGPERSRAISNRAAHYGHDSFSPRGNSTRTAWVLPSPFSDEKAEAQRGPVLFTVTQHVGPMGGAGRE